MSNLKTEMIQYQRSIAFASINLLPELFDQMIIECQKIVDLGSKSEWGDFIKEVFYDFCKHPNIKLENLPNGSEYIL